MILLRHPEDNLDADIIRRSCGQDSRVPSGGDDMVEVEHLRQEITLTLASAQMNLRKWKSNMQLVNGGDTSQSSLDLNMGGLESTKTLGLGWQAMSDVLCFPISDSVKD
ncbi:unnamed protein product, partial [Danaus chrysippus]